MGFTIGEMKFQEFVLKVNKRQLKYDMQTASPGLFEKGEALFTPDQLQFLTDYIHQENVALLRQFYLWLRREHLIEKTSFRIK